MRATKTYQRLTSLPLAVLLFIDKIWLVIWAILSLLVVIYKGLGLPFPVGPFIYEFVMIVLYVPLALARNFLGDMGNKTERSSHLVWFLVLTLPVAAVHVYYVAFQIYVLVFDVVLNAISFVWIIGDSFFAVMSAINFGRHER